MLRLAMVLFSLIATSLMGSAVVVVLSMGYDTTRPILAAVAVGFIVALPVSWGVARAIYTS
jgi:hypothetical protein